MCITAPYNGLPYMTSGLQPSNLNLLSKLHVQIGSSMEEAEFTMRVVPCVSKLFTSTDRSIRRSLLENIDSYGKHLTQVGLLLIFGCHLSCIKFMYVYHACAEVKGCL